jgi:hypothetical protein
MQSIETQVGGMFCSTGDVGTDGRDGSKGGNVEFEWKVEEGESSGDVFDFKAMAAGADGTETTMGMQQGQQISQQIQQSAQAANGQVDADAGNLAAALSGPSGSGSAGSNPTFTITVTNAGGYADFAYDADIFDFKAMEARSTNGCTGDACNGGAAGILFGDGGDGAQGGVSTAQLTISGTISDLSAADGRYSFVFDGNAAGGHTTFDGKFLTAHDLAREQAYLSDTGFDLV